MPRRQKHYARKVTGYVPWKLLEGTTQPRQGFINEGALGLNRHFKDGWGESEGAEGFHSAVQG